jgi:hypothetical protein
VDAFTLITFLLIVFVGLSLFTKVIPYGLWITAAFTLGYLVLALIGFVPFGLIF